MDIIQNVRQLQKVSCYNSFSWAQVKIYRHINLTWNYLFQLCSKKRLNLKQVYKLINLMRLLTFVGTNKSKNLDPISQTVLSWYHFVTSEYITANIDLIETTKTTKFYALNSFFLSKPSSSLVLWYAHTQFTSLTVHLHFVIPKRIKNAKL